MALSIGIENVDNQIRRGIISWTEAAEVFITDGKLVNQEGQSHGIDNRQ